MSTQLQELKTKEYLQQLVVERLRKTVFSAENPSMRQEMEDLTKAERKLTEYTQERQAFERQQDQGVIFQYDSNSFDSSSSGQAMRGQVFRGENTTGITVQVKHRMQYVPTSICHLLNVQDNPLLTFELTTSKDSRRTKRIRVTSYIEGYSARAVGTYEIEPGETLNFNQLPTLFPDRIKHLNELSQATLTILVEDLDGKVETETTYPIWLLARNSSILHMDDPATGKTKEMYDLLGSFVTPNQPDVMHFLRTVADYHPDKRLVGYQGTQSDTVSKSQVKAIFEALQQAAGITYVNSVIDFNPNRSAFGQRIRLPRESLLEKQANCIDGTLLYASLLEGCSINPAIVLIPGHAFLAWETWENNSEWKYLETTMTGNASFEDACQSAERTAEYYRGINNLRLLSVRDLRVLKSITPME